MKKFLSLVMALALTVSLVTVSAGAKDFTDKSTITYGEAVDVISGIGVVDGYTDGSFNPTATLTRGAAAKIICNLMLGPTTAAALGVTTAPFTDVPVTNVFAGYIAYCSAQGIINGYGDGTFKPAATVTGYQFMKMLLGALGYDGSIEGFTGSNWTVNVAKLAISIGLDDGNAAFLGSKAMTREEACLYAFNTLTADVVTYTSKGTTITVNGATIVTGASDAEKVTIDSEGSDNYAGADGDGVGTQQFCEKSFSKLSYDTATDSFGRPSHKWIYDDTTLGTYADDADQTIVMSASGKDITTILTSSSYMDYDTDEIVYSASLYDGTFKLNGDAATIDGAGAYSSTKGDIIETYDTNSDDIIDTVIVSQYTAAKIDSVDSDLTSTATKNGATYELTITNLNGDDLGDTYYDAYKNDAGVLPGYTSDYTEGTILAVALNSSDEILDSYVATTVTGDVTSYKADSYAYLDGTKYSFGTVDTSNGTTSSFDFDSAYNFYVSAEGYVIGVEGASVANISDVYYVSGVYMNTSSMGTTSYYAQVVALDGTVSTIKMEAASFEQITGISDPDADTLYPAIYEENGSTIPTAPLYTFSDKSADRDAGGIDTTSGNGKFVALTWDGSSDYDVAMDTLQADVASSDSKLYVGTVDTANKYYLESTTKYVSVDGTGDNIDVATATGGMKCAATQDALDAYTTNVIVITKDGKDTALYVLYVGADLSSTISSDSVLYVAADTDVVNGDGTYQATVYFMDNPDSVTTITVDDSESVGFYTYSVDSDDVYTLDVASGAITEAVADDTDGFSTDLSITSIHNYTLLNATYFDDIDVSGAVVIDQRGDDADEDLYTATINSVSKLSSALDKGAVTVDLYVDNGAITFICVTAAADAV